MLIKFVEYLLSVTFNRSRSRQERRLSQKPIRKVTGPIHIPEGHVLLGREIGAANPGAETGAVTLSAEARRRHLYVLGATGTGKSNLLLRFIESDIDQKRSFCVIDLRGDLIDRIMLRLSASNTADAWRERLLLLDLRDDSNVVGFNPLAGAGDVYSRAFQVLSILRQQSESWGIQLEETLRNCLIALAETGWSLLEVEPLLCKPAFRRQVLARVTDNYVRSFFDRYEQLSDDQKTAWSLPVLNKITPLLAIPRLRRMFGQRHSVSLQKMLDDQPGRVILVSLAVDRLHQAAYLVGSLFVSAFQNAIMARVDQPEQQRIPVHLYIDEFETMATDQFEAIVAEGRRFGLGLCLSHQNLSQMPTNLRQVLLNNVHSQFYFQTGAQDAALLAREISTDQKRDAITRLLTQQKTGETFLVQRGHPSKQIRIEHCPDPKVEPAAVHAIRDVAMQTYARSKDEIDRELQERLNQASEVPPAIAPVKTPEAPDTAPDLPEASPEIAQAKEEPDYEIRHAPRKRKPKTKQ